MRKQYHFRPSKNGFYAWDVDKLIEHSKDFPLIKVPLENIRELDENFWYNSHGSIPTCRSIAEHMKLVNETDLRFPIILCNDGRVMDGMHRVLKALLKGENSILAVQFERDPEPDHVDIQEDDLSY